MRVLVEVVDPRRVERRRAADQAVHLVALAEQQLGQVGAVLAGDPGDQCALHNSQPILARMPHDGRPAVADRRATLRDGRPPPQALPRHPGHSRIAGPLVDPPPGGGLLPVGGVRALGDRLQARRPGHPEGVHLGPLAVRPHRAERVAHGQVGHRVERQVAESLDGRRRDLVGGVVDEREHPHPVGVRAEVAHQGGEPRPHPVGVGPAGQPDEQLVGDAGVERGRGDQHRGEVAALGVPVEQRLADQPRQHPVLVVRRLLGSTRPRPVGQLGGELLGLGREDLLAVRHDVPELAAPGLVGRLDEGGPHPRRQLGDQLDGWTRCEQ